MGIVRGRVEMGPRQVIRRAAFRRPARCAATLLVVLMASASPLRADTVASLLGNFTINQEAGFTTSTYTLIQTDSLTGISGTFAGGATSISGTIGLYDATVQIDTVGGDEDIQLVVTPASVPEPRTWDMLISGLIAFFFRALLRKARV